jgi:integrase
VAFRRSELVALTVADLVEAPDGFRVIIRRSKTDQEGEGQEVAIPHGYKVRPVETVQARLAAAEISSGPVFRPVSQRGIVATTALGDDGFIRMLKRRIAALGLDPAAFSGHSLRSGFLDERRRGGGERVQAERGQPAPIAGYVARLCPPRRSVQGPCRGRIPMTSIPEITRILARIHDWQDEHGKPGGRADAARRLDEARSCSTRSPTC